MKTVSLPILLAVLMAASVCWAADPACLVVRNINHKFSHEHVRVMSTGEVPFKLKYSDKELRQLAAVEKVYVVEIDAHERINSDTCIVGLPAKPMVAAESKQMVATTAEVKQVKPVNPVEKLEKTEKQAAEAPDSRNDMTCLAWITNRKGEQNCIERQQSQEQR